MNNCMLRDQKQIILYSFSVILALYVFLMMSTPLARGMFKKIDLESRKTDILWINNQLTKLVSKELCYMNARIKLTRIPIQSNTFSMIKSFGGQYKLAVYESFSWARRNWRKCQYWHHRLYCVKNKIFQKQNFTLMNSKPQDLRFQVQHYFRHFYSEVWGTGVNSTFFGTTVK